MQKCFVLIVLFICLSCSKSKKEQAAIHYASLSNVSLASGSLVRVENFTSKYIQARNVDVWLPENYSPKKKYAVLYMHDGQMLFDSTKTWNKQEWKVDEWASKLIKNKQVREFIVVAPHNIPEIRHSDYFPKKPFLQLTPFQQDSLLTEAKKSGMSFTSLNSDNYLKFLVTELKPYIDKTFATLPDRQSTFVMGSSMGGLISMYAVSEYPDVFGGAACLSTHWIGTYTNKNNPIPEAFFKYMHEHLPSAKTHKIYFDYGTETLDALYLPYQQSVTEIINNKGHQKNSKYEGHDHSENSWNKRLDQPITYMLSN